MAFFNYRQNNSGGSFIEDDKTSLNMIIEAECAKDADYVAETYTPIYFDGVEKHGDCECCGDRWRRADGDGSDKPMIYELDLEDWAAGKVDADTIFTHFITDSMAIVHFFDGTRKTYDFKSRTVSISKWR